MSVQTPSGQLTYFWKKSYVPRENKSLIAFGVLLLSLFLRAKSGRNQLGISHDGSWVWTSFFNPLNTHYTSTLHPPLSESPAMVPIFKAGELPTKQCLLSSSGQHHMGQEKHTADFCNHKIMGVGGAHLKPLVLLHSSRNLEQPVKVAIFGPVDWCWGRANPRRLSLWDAWLGQQTP